MHKIKEFLRCNPYYFAVINGDIYKDDCKSVEEAKMAILEGLEELTAEGIAVDAMLTFVAMYNIPLQ